MAKKSGCGGCLVKTLISLVVIAVIVFTAGWFGGNALMKRYIGDNGSYMALGINNWNDLGDFFTVFKGSAPETAESDRVSDANREKTEGYLADKGVVLPKTEEGKPDYGKLFDGSVTVTEEIGLDGGMIAVVLDGCLAEIGTFADYGARVEAATVTAENESTGTLSVVMSLSKSTLLDEIGVKGFSRTVINMLLRGETVYLTLSTPLQAEGGRLSEIAADAEAQPTIRVNDLTAADSAKIVGTIAAAVQPDARDSFERDLTNQILNQFNQSQTQNGSELRLAKDYAFGAFTADAIVLGRQTSV